MFIYIEVELSSIIFFTADVKLKKKVQNKRDLGVRLRSIYKFFFFLTIPGEQEFISHPRGRHF